MPPVTDPDLSTLREQLQAAAPGLGPAIIDTLAVAMQAKKKVRLAEPCTKCSCSHVRWVEIPDAAAATNAVKVFLEQVEGRPGVLAGVIETPLIVRRVGKSRS